MPNSSDLSRSRSLTDANRDRLRAINSSYSSGVGGSGSSSTLLHPSSHVKSSDNGPSSSTYGKKKLNSNTIKSPNSSTSSLNRRSQVYYSSSQDEAEEEEGGLGDENNNGSRSGRSSVRRKGAPPKVALGGAGSALDTVDGDIKVTQRSRSRGRKTVSDNNKLNSEEEEEQNINNYSAPQQSRALLLSLSVDAAADNNNPLINRIPSANQSHSKQRQENSNGSTKKVININNNVTRISINQHTTNGTSIILNNSNSQCTSANRAIVHIFNADEEVQQQVEDLRNNNNNNNLINNKKSINRRSTTTEKSEITCGGGSNHPLNGDPRRQRGAKESRTIETGGTGTGTSNSNSSNGTMLLRQANGTTATMAQRSAASSSYGSVNGGGGGKFKRDSEIFLRDECDLVRNELMQKKIAEHNPVEERLNGSGSTAVNGVSRKNSSTSMSMNSLVSKQNGESSVKSLSNGVKTIKVTVRTRPENNNINNPNNTKTAGQNLKERMENGFRTELEERRSMILQNGGGGVSQRNGVALRGRISPMDIDSIEEQINGFNGSTKAAKKSSTSSHSSSSSSSSASSLMDSGRSNFEDIKFIDSDDNNEANGGGGAAAAVGAAMNGASSRMSKLNKSLASTLETLKASTPIVGSGRHQYNVTSMNGHHTLPYHSSSNSLGSASGRLAGGDYSKKYSTLSSLPSKSAVTAAAIRNGLSNGLFGERKTYSNDAIIMGLVPKEHENTEELEDEMKEHSLIIKETEMDAMVTSSEPPNDKISGKSWEVNGTNGSGVSVASSSTTSTSTSSLLIAFP